MTRSARTAPTYRLSVEREFPAVHAIVMGGERERPHEHLWRVRVVIEGDSLDEDGLLCDFHIVQSRLDALVATWRGRDFNATPPFDTINPTAEHIALHVAQEMTPALPAGVRLACVDVTEAPGCVATCLVP